MTLTNNMPEVIFAYETNCKNKGGFGHWYDADVSGEGKENQCTQYHHNDTVQALKDENERLKGALERIAKGKCDTYGFDFTLGRYKEIAEQALKGQGDE